jgi:GGDEF domain-containing protein
MATQETLPQVKERGEFRGQIDAALKSAKAGTASALILMHVAGLSGRSMNVLGPGMSQAALKAVFQAITGALEETGQVSRTGSSTFAILMPEAEPMFAKVAVGEILGKVKAAVQGVAGNIPAEYHAGMAFHPMDGGDAETLCQTARTALRASKKLPSPGVLSAEEAGRYRTSEDVLYSNLPPKKLTGREPELQKLLRRLDATRKEKGALVFLRGEPGVGKGRLLDEFLASIPGDVLAMSARLDATCAYKAFETVTLALEGFVRKNKVPPERLLRGLDASLARAVSGVLPSLASTGDSGDGPPNPEWRRGVFQGLAGILTGLGPQEVLVAAIHDVQWMDAASIELFSYLIRSGRLRVMLTGTVDDLFLRNPLNQEYPVAELIGMASAIPFLHEVRLTRLSRNSLVQMAETLLPGLETAGQERVLEQTTAGNPLSVIGTLSFFAREGGIVIGEGGKLKLEPKEIPPRTLDGQIEKMIAALDEDLRMVCMGLAVLGRPSDAAEIGTVIGEAAAEVIDSAEELIVNGVLQENEGRYWFTAEHFAQVVWRASDLMKLRELHLKRAETAEQGLSDIAVNASKSHAAALSVMRRQSYSLYHRHRGGDSEGVQRLYTGVRNSMKMIFNTTEVDEYLRGDVGELPAAAQGTLSPSGEQLLRRFLDLSIEALADIQAGSSNPSDIHVKVEMTAVMASFFAENANLTLSFREGLPRALGQPLSAHAFGDTPSLLAQFMRAGGIWVTTMDHRTKIDEWLWLLVGLGFDPPPVGTPEDWTYFLQDKGVRYIGIEPAPAKQGTPPKLGGGRKRAGYEEAPQTVSFSLDKPVQTKQSGKARSAVFDTSVDVKSAGGGRLSAEAATILAEAEVPLGLSPVQLKPENAEKLTTALEKLLKDARTEEASSLFLRVVAGVEQADAAGRIAFYEWLEALEPTIARIGERRSVEAAARELMSLVDAETDEAGKKALAQTSAWMVRFLVDIGHYDIGGALAQAAVRNKGLHREFIQAVMKSDLVEVIISDIASEDAAREGAISPLASILAEALAPVLGRLLVHTGAYRVRRASAKLLKKAGEHTVKQLVDELVRPGRPAEERARLIDVLDTLLSDIAPFVGDLFVDEDEPVRLAAAALMHRLSDEDIEKVLEKVEKAHGLSAAAALAGKALSRGGLPTVLKAIVRPDAVAQINGALALGDLTAANSIPPRQAVEALSALLSNTARKAAETPDDTGLTRVGLAALTALKVNPLPEAQETLRKHLEIKLEGLRREIKRYLGIPDEEAPKR